MSAKNDGAARRRFFDNLEKRRGVSLTPQQGEGEFVYATEGMWKAEGG